MSDVTKAVFLSYASQDAEAAKRICDALRAAGVEVWFDQSELVGGDAWDQKIRRQIKDCALLIPIISANTQQRTEGYFRLEWRLADQRTHLMAKGRPFLLPVVIDDTRDVDAHVPDSFTEVQWTRLPNGEAGAAFATRVKKLLGGSEMEAGRPRPAERGEGTAAPKKSFRPWLVAVIIVAAILAGVWQQQRNHAPVPVLPAAKSGSQPEVARLLAQVRGLADKTDVLRTELDTATDLLGQAAKLDSADAAVWAEWALVDCRYIDEYYDRSVVRLDEARRHAAQATGLDSKNPRARFAQACVMLRLASDASTKAAAEKILQPLLAEIPDQGPVLLELGWLAFDGAHPETALERFDRAAAIPGYAGRAHYAKALVSVRAGLLAQGEAEFDRALQSERAAKFLLWKSYLLTIWEGDTTAALRMLEEVPAAVWVEDMPATARHYVAMLARDYDQALAALRAVPHDYFQSRATTGPAGLFKGNVLALAGKPAAAELEWRSGLAVVERRLATEPNDEDLMTYKVLLQVALGDRAAALPTWKALQELYGQDVQASPDLQMQMLPPEEALAWVTGKVARGSLLVTAAKLRLDPVYNPIRSLPGFATLLARAEADSRLSPNAKAKSTEAAAAPVDDKSVAVLAFANLSDDKANEYFSDGISEELLNVLAKVPGLKVTARTSSFHFKGKDTPIPEIAQQLGVAYVVEGSVRKAGDKVRITAQLIKAADDFHVWSDTFTRDLKDIFAVQDEIAGLITQNLQLKLGMATQAGRTANQEAYQVYLQGKYFLDRATLEDAARATTLLQHAVELDPSFAPAWAALSGAGWYRGSYGNNRQDFDEGYALARRAADRAIALEPALAAGHLARFDLQASIDYDWKSSAESLHRAQALAPNDAGVALRAAQLAYTFADQERAIELNRQAVALDPVNPQVYTSQGYTYLAAHRFAEAEAAFRHIIEISPSAPWGYTGVGMSLIARGQFDLAAAEVEKESTSWARLYGLSLARWGQKNRAQADAVLAQFIQANADVAAYQIASVYAYRGEPDKAFEWLERAYRQRDPGLSWAKPDYFLEPLHADPRWNILLRKLGLADDQLK